MSGACLNCQKPLADHLMLRCPGVFRTRYTAPDPKDDGAFVPLAVLIELAHIANAVESFAQYQGLNATDDRVLVAFEKAKLTLGTVRTVRNILVSLNLPKDGDYK